MSALSILQPRSRRQKLALQLVHWHVRVMPAVVGITPRYASPTQSNREEDGALILVAQSDIAQTDRSAQISERSGLRRTLVAVSRHTQTGWIDLSKSPAAERSWFAIIAISGGELRNVPISTISWLSPSLRYTRYGLG
jgi:hypothetical protein